MFERGLSGQMFDDRTVWDHLDAAGLAAKIQENFEELGI